jgi:3-hydroxyacyl-CoA dehydrogenase/3a,7a,12a-trihydroxy-5b-cholest-24-enoyl-CoA hydratase
MASMKLGFLKKIDMSKVKPGSGAKPAAAAAAPAAAPKSAQAPAILERAAGRLAEAKTAGTIKLVVKDPDNTFVVSSTGVSAASGDVKADAVVTLADGDLAELAHGKVNLQTLYQRGKLRVDGDIKAAQVLALLQGLA